MAKHAADPVGMATLQSEATFAKETELRQSQSLHHVIEPDH
ncbi:hypothetical protein [Leptolyngbya sp. FACHB-321]|nr:hypothetical protein [Leptolyngbya sp. FACHB-321]